VSASGRTTIDEHRRRVESLAQVLRSSRGAVRLRKRTSNLFRPRKEARRVRLDGTTLRHVIAIDPQARTAEVEGMTTYADLVDATGLPSGTVYPILRRLDREGLLQSNWEEHAKAQKEQRPPRRYYAITEAGERMLDAAAERYRTLDQAVAPSHRRLKPSQA